MRPLGAHGDPIGLQKDPWAHGAPMGRHGASRSPKEPMGSYRALGAPGLYMQTPDQPLQWRRYVTQPTKVIKGPIDNTLETSAIDIIMTKNWSLNSLLR